MLRDINQNMLKMHFIKSNSLELQALHVLCMLKHIMSSLFYLSHILDNKVTFVVLTHQWQLVGNNYVRFEWSRYGNQTSLDMAANTP